MENCSKRQHVGEDHKGTMKFSRCSEKGELSGGGCGKLESFGWKSKSLNQVNQNHKEVHWPTKSQRQRGPG